VGLGSAGLVRLGLGLGLVSVSFRLDVLGLYDKKCVCVCLDDNFRTKWPLAHSNFFVFYALYK